MRVLILVFFSSLIPLKIFSQAAVLEKNNITVGDQIQLHVQIDKSKGEKIEFPVFENNIIDGIEIIKRSEIFETDNQTRLRQTYTITSFEDSLFLIKPFIFKVDGKEISTNALQLKVTYYKPDSAFISKIDTSNNQIPIADIKPVMNTPMTFNEFIKRFWMYIIGVIVLVILFFVIRYYLRKIKKDEPIFVKPEPRIPAHIPALEKLNQLKEKQVHKQSNLKPFYTELSTIIRTYIENRFDIPALESVTTEIIDEFDKTQYAVPEMISKVKDLLSLSDMVKFAKDKPDSYKNELMIEYAFSFINFTKEAEIIEEQTKTENEI